MGLNEYASIATIISCMIGVITLIITCTVKKDVKNIKKNITNSNDDKGIFASKVDQSISVGVRDDDK